MWPLVVMVLAVVAAAWGFAFFVRHKDREEHRKAH